jgi:hypothetical protein
MRLFNQPHYMDIVKGAVFAMVAMPTDAWAYKALYAVDIADSWIPLYDWIDPSYVRA